MIKRYKKTCKYLNYFSTFASLICVPVGITRSTVGSFVEFIA